MNGAKFYLVEIDRLLSNMSSNYSKKIDVSVEQIRAIYGQLLEAMREKAQKSLPHGLSEKPQNNDALQRALQMYLQEYLVRVMDMSSNSLNIVNIDQTNEQGKTTNISELLARTHDKYVEPFDQELNEEVRQKYQEWEDLTVKVSQLRRDGPQKVNELYNNSKENFFKDLDSKINDLSTESQEPNTQVSPIEKTHIAEVFDSYEKILSQLSSTKDQIPETRADINQLRILLSFLKQEE